MINIPYTTGRGNKFYFQVFMAVVHQLLVFFWVSALCSGWQFQWFRETYTLTFRVNDSSLDGCSSIPLNRISSSKILELPLTTQCRNPKQARQQIKDNVLSLLHQSLVVMPEFFFHYKKIWVSNERQIPLHFVLPVTTREIPYLPECKTI